MGKKMYAVSCDADFEPFNTFNTFNTFNPSYYEAESPEEALKMDHEATCPDDGTFYVHELVLVGKYQVKNSKTYILLRKVND